MRPTAAATADLFFKQSTISNILMFQDYLPQYQYTYKELIKLDLIDLEYLREDLRKQYNEVVTVK